MTPTVRPLLLLAAASIALCGCELGPDYHAPATPGSAAGPLVSTALPAATTDPLPNGWWRLYQDPVLDGLVREALTENNDLKVAAANLAYAQGVLSEARAGFFPSTSLSAGYGRDKSALEKPVTLYTAGFIAAYQVDLFGRVRRTAESAHASAQAAEAARDVVRVTVAAETAGAYANACAFGEEAEVARQSLKVVQQTYDILIEQRRVGAASDLDVAREATLLDQAKAAVPGLEGQRRAALFELAVLTGKPPAQFPAEVAGCVTPPKLTRPIPTGDGAALLRRRPDVREADRNLAAATAKIGVAEADFFPSVSLGASASTASTSIAHLGQAAANAYGLGPGIAWTFPNTLVARAHVKESSAQASAALASFDGTVLTALKEVEQALATYQAELARHDALTGARDHAAEAYQLAETQYRLGSLSFLDLLTAQATYIGAQQALAGSDQLLAADQVAVFQALGGGWQDAPKVVAPRVR